MQRLTYNVLAALITANVYDSKEILLRITLEMSMNG